MLTERLWSSVDRGHLEDREVKGRTTVHENGFVLQG